MKLYDVALPSTHHMLARLSEYPQWLHHVAPSAFLYHTSFGQFDIKLVLFQNGPCYCHAMRAQFIRRKFRSQTSDNMDKWESRGGMSQRRETQKREA